MATSEERMTMEDGRRPSSAKRPRTDPEGQQHQHNDPHSVEALLSVPLAIVFRKCTLQEGRPLLTRAEAECFLKLSFLAQEIDTLVGVAEEILMQQTYSCSYHQKFVHPMLRPVIPILSMLETQPKAALQDLQSSLCQLVAELRGCAGVLRQSAEQNWTLADALEGLDANKEHSLSEEKRRLADLEEEIVSRIEKLVLLSNYEQAEIGMPTENPCRELFAANEASDDNASEQDYALDTKPISDLCSELFEAKSLEIGEKEDDGKDRNKSDSSVDQMEAAEIERSKRCTENGEETNGQIMQTENDISQEMLEDAVSNLPTGEKVQPNLSSAEKEQTNFIAGEKEQPKDNGIPSSMTSREDNSHSDAKFPVMRTQPDLSGTYSGLSSDDIVDDDEDDDDDHQRHRRFIDFSACSQRTSNAAEMLAVLANTAI